MNEFYQVTDVTKLNVFNSTQLHQPLSEFLCLRLCFVLRLLIDLSKARMPTMFDFGE